MTFTIPRQPSPASDTTGKRYDPFPSEAYYSHSQSLFLFQSIIHLPGSGELLRLNAKAQEDWEGLTGLHYD